MNTAPDIVDSWLTLPDIAEAADIGISKVRRWVEDRALCGIKHGDPVVFRVPELFLDGGAPVPSLKGTIILLEDAGFSSDEAITWLFTDDDSLPGRPIDKLREGNKGEVRRRAQALAF